MNPGQARGVKLTVAAVLAFIIVIVGGFVYRIQQPRVMTVAEMKANGLYLLETPRDIGEFELVAVELHVPPLAAEVAESRGVAAEEWQRDRAVLT